MNLHYRLLHAVAALWAATAAVGQLPFSLDTTFRTEFISKNVNSIALMDSGKVLCSGMMKYPGDMSFRGSSRLLNDGSRDMAFTAFQGAAKITPWNGLYYVDIGTIHRLDADGYLDPTFINMNSGPYVSIGAGGGYHVYPDGRILFAGFNDLSDSIRGFMGVYDLTWFSNTGYLDTTKTHRRGSGSLSHIKELPNGQFMGSGNISQWEGKAVDWVFRMHADGTPDTTFRTGVYVGSALDFMGLPDGRVYAGGKFRRTQAPSDTLELVRFKNDGSLDSSFVIPQFSDDTLNGPFIGPGVSAIYPWPGDRLLVVGQFRYVNGEPRNSICVFDSTGALGPEFDACGVEAISDGFWTYSSIDCVVIDTANQHMYICGGYWGYNDGTTNDTQQRFVSRLHLGNFGMGAAEQEPAQVEKVLHLYPNPASGQVTVQYHVDDAARAQLLVRDMSRRMVLSEQIDLSRGVHALDVSGLAPGVYYLHMVHGSTWVSGCKLVVE